MAAGGGRRQGSGDLFNQFLGFRTGDQRPVVDLQGKIYKIDLAEDILEGLALGPTAHQGAQPAQECVRHRSFKLDIEVHSLAIQDVGKNELGVETGIFQVLLSKESRREIKDLEERLHGPRL